MRYRSLDSVRGLAALAVVLYHAFLSLVGGGENREQLLQYGVQAPMAWLYATPLRLAVSGPAAVILFFVLSGFVLTISLESRTTYLGYAISRFARIWLPFSVAILASAALCLFLSQTRVPGSSTWFQAQWGMTLTGSDVIRHLTMVGTIVDLDSPMWSLIHELRISLLVPLLILFWSRFGNYSILAAAALSLVSVATLGNVPMPARYSSWVSTGTYVYFFVLGIAIASEREKFAQMVAPLKGGVVPLLWAIALAGLAVAPADTSSVVTMPNGLLLLANGLAAALLIVLCASKQPSLLLRRIPMFLGRISYSLYLTHMVVIMAVLHLIAGRLPIQVGLTLAVPFAICVADVCQRYVELPSQKAGKFMSQRLYRRRIVAVRRPD